MQEESTVDDFKRFNKIIADSNSLESIINMLDTLEIYQLIDILTETTISRNKKLLTEEVLKYVNICVPNIDEYVEGLNSKIKDTGFYWCSEVIGQYVEPYIYKDCRYPEDFSSLEDAINKHSRQGKKTVSIRLENIQ